MTFRLATAVLAVLAMSGAALAAEQPGPPAAAAPAAAPPPQYGAPIGLEQARAIVQAAQAEARRRGIAISVAVVDSGGYMVLAERMDGASLASSESVILKARSAVLWQRPTSAWLPVIEASHGSQTTYPNIYAGTGGELLLVNGRIVGAVGVGGTNGPNETDISKIAVQALK